MDTNTASKILPRERAYNVLRSLANVYTTYSTFERQVLEYPARNGEREFLKKAKNYLDERLKKANRFYSLDERLIEEILNNVLK